MVDYPPGPHTEAGGRSARGEGGRSKKRKMREEKSPNNKFLSRYIAAQVYTERGWLIHPVHAWDDLKVDEKARGKAPILKGWQNRERPATVTEIERWFKDTNYNIGLQTGKRSGVTVIDYDHDLFWSLLIKNLPLNTLESFRIEGRGHVFFQYVPDFKSKKYHILGIEILNDGNNAILPPSRHREGQIYRWRNPDAPLSPMPDELKARLRELFDAYERLSAAMAEVRPCFRRLWNHGKPEPLHGGDGREAMAAWMLELRAHGCNLTAIKILARLVYRDRYDSEITTREWQNWREKPWTCQKIRERLSGIISCEGCPLAEKKRKEKIKTNIAVEIGEDLLRKYVFKTFKDTEEVLVYLDGVYQFNGESLIKEEARKILEDRFTSGIIHNVINYIKYGTFIDREAFNNEIEWINVRNGILNVKTGELREHTPEFLTTVRIPVKYDPKADCPAIKRFLREIVKPEDVKILEEIAGYCLYREYFIKKAVMLVGGGNNGKSTYLNLLRAFLGGQNVSNVSIHDLERNRFAAAMLFGKLANIYPDLPDSELRSTATFKALTGGDYIKAEKKFSDLFMFQNTAKLLFSTNTIPITHDSTEAFFARWLIIDFPNKFSDDGPRKPNKKLLEELTTEEELSGFLNLALQGLQRLLKNQKFSYKKTPEEIAEEYLRLSNTVYGFISDWCEIDIKAQTPKSELYNAYVNYCSEIKQTAYTHKKFSEELRRLVNVIETRPKIKDERVMAWRGIRITKVGKTPDMGDMGDRNEEDVRDVRDVTDSHHLRENENYAKCERCGKTAALTIYNNIGVCESCLNELKNEKKATAKKEKPTRTVNIKNISEDGSIPREAYDEDFQAQQAKEAKEQLKEAIGDD